MAQIKNKLLDRRITRAYLSSIVSIALVLLVIGVASLLAVNTRGVENYFRENLHVTVIMKNRTSEQQALKYQKSIEMLRCVKSARLVTVEEGTAEMTKMLGEDFLKVFSVNPVPVSVEVVLRPEYVNTDSIPAVREMLGGYPGVGEVSFQQSAVESLENSMARISAVLGVFIVLLLFISVALISNVVRLTLYSHRFTIHTMQLVGATDSYIRAPYLLSSVRQGFISALIAVVCLLSLMFLIKSSFAQVFSIFTPWVLLESIVIMAISGVAICFCSTALLLRRISSLSKDELYG